MKCLKHCSYHLIPTLKRWIYRIDPKRVNEYGQVLAADVDATIGESKKDK